MGSSIADIVEYGFAMIMLDLAELNVRTASDIHLNRLSSTPGRRSSNITQRGACRKHERDTVVAGFNDRNIDWDFTGERHAHVSGNMFPATDLEEINLFAAFRGSSGPCGTSQLSGQS